MISKRIKINAIIQQLKKLTPEVFVEIVTGVKNDISIGKYHEKEMVTPIFTAEDILAIDGWRRNVDVITEMTQAAVGRAIRAICISHGIDPSTDLSEQEIKRIASHIDRTERLAIAMLLKSAQPRDYQS